MSALLHIRFLQFLSSRKLFNLIIERPSFFVSIKCSKYSRSYIFYKKMNYTNYFPFLSMSYPVTVPYPPYPYVIMIPNTYSKHLVSHYPCPTSQQQKKQLSFDEVNFAQVEAQLRKIHFQQPRHKNIHWTLEEDKILQRLVQIQKLEWKDIPKYFQGRTQNMCYSRYRRISLATKDRVWTSDQQQILSVYVSRFGQKWKFISQKMPKFTPKQIRQRYLNYLRPHINKQNFSFQEDLKICQYVLKDGRHWRKMEQNFPNRTEGIIKGRYYGKLKEIIQNSVKKGH